MPQSPEGREDPASEVGHGGQGADAGGEHLTREQKLELWRRSKGKGPAAGGKEAAPSQSRARLLKPLSSSQANSRPAPRPSSTPPQFGGSRLLPAKEGPPSRTPEGAPCAPVAQGSAFGTHGIPAAPVPEDAEGAEASHPCGGLPPALPESPQPGLSPTAEGALGWGAGLSSSTHLEEGAARSDEACSHPTLRLPATISKAQTQTSPCKDPQPAASAQPMSGLETQGHQLLRRGVGICDEDDEVVEEEEVSKEDLQVQLFDTSNRLAQCTALLQRMVEENGQLRGQLNEMRSLQEKCAMLESTVVELRVLQGCSEVAWPSEIAREQQDSEGGSKRARTEGNDCAVGAGGLGGPGGSSWAEREMGEVSRLRLTLAAQQKEYMEERQRHIEKMMKSEQRARAAESAVADVNLEWQQLFDSQMKTLQEQLKVALEKKSEMRNDSNTP